MFAKFSLSQTSEETKEKQMLFECACYIPSAPLINVMDFGYLQKSDQFSTSCSVTEVEEYHNRTQRMGVQPPLQPEANIYIYQFQSLYILITISERESTMETVSLKHQSHSFLGQHLAVLMKALSTNIQLRSEEIER